MAGFISVGEWKDNCQEEQPQVSYSLFLFQQWQVAEEKSIIALHIALQDLKQFYAGPGGNGRCLEKWL